LKDGLSNYFYMKKSLFLILLLSGLSQLQAQSEEAKPLSLSQVSIQLGNYGISNNYGGSLEEFKSLSPNSGFLDQDFDDYDQTFFKNGMDFYSTFSIHSTFDWNGKNDKWKSLHPQLRFGFTSGKANFMNGSLNRTRSHRVDTLVSSRNGQEYFIDSVRSETYTLNYDANFLVINAALIIGSNPKSTWSIYGGVGLSVGMNYNAKSRVEFYSSYSYEGLERFGGETYSDEWDESTNVEYHSNNGLGLSFMMSLPLGVNFRLSKEKEFWRYTSLFYEFQPGVSFFDVKGIGGNFYSSVYNSIGMRVSFWE